MRAQRYILKEVQRIYNAQGATIHDKHVEVIIRQMFSRVRIKDPGDSLFVPREIVEKKKAMRENERLAKEKKKICDFVPVLLGVSKVALTTNSFYHPRLFRKPQEC